MRISQEKIHTLADFWPLAGFLFDGPVDDPAARERWLGPEGRAALPTRARRSRRCRASTRPRVAEALEAVVRARAAKPREVYQPLRVAICGTTSRRASSRASRCWVARRALRRIDRALAGG